MSVGAHPTRICRPGSLLLQSYLCANLQLQISLVRTAQSADISVCEGHPCMAAEGTNHLHPLLPSQHLACTLSGFPQQPPQGSWWESSPGAAHFAAWAVPAHNGNLAAAICRSRAFPQCNNLSLFFNVVVTLWLNQYLQFVSSPGRNKIVFQVLKHPIKVCKAVVL